MVMMVPSPHITRSAALLCFVFSPGEPQPCSAPEIRGTVETQQWQSVWRQSPYSNWHITSHPAAQLGYYEVRPGLVWQHHDSSGFWRGKPLSEREGIELQTVRVFRNVSTCIDKIYESSIIKSIKLTIHRSLFNNCSLNDNSQLIRVLAYGLTPVYKLH